MLFRSDTLRNISGGARNSTRATHATAARSHSRQTVASRSVFAAAEALRVPPNADGHRPLSSDAGTARIRRQMAEESRQTANLSHSQFVWPNMPADGRLLVLQG